MIGNPPSFKRWGWAVAFGKVMCPSCLAALLRPYGVPTQQEYAKWAATVVALSVPAGRGLDLSDLDGSD